MAGHEWDWFQREELIGHISDIRVQNLQVERVSTQKRTFTRWINFHLYRCNPPLEVKDLFKDMQDGKILMALLEVLSGQRLMQQYKHSTHRIFRLNNIAKALQFLEEGYVRLVSIDAHEIADGNPSMILGLIWNIILHFQIKEATGHLKTFSPTSSLSSLHSGSDNDLTLHRTPKETAPSAPYKDQRRVIKVLLNWVQRRITKYGVAIQDFSTSWRSGIAFLALIKAIDPSLVDMRKAMERPNKVNLEDAFKLAHINLDIPPLLEPEDVDVEHPEEQSITTYVSQFLEHFPDIDENDTAENAYESPFEDSCISFATMSSDLSAQDSNVGNKHCDSDIVSPPLQDCTDFIPSYLKDDKLSAQNVVMNDNQPLHEENDNSFVIQDSSSNETEMVTTNMVEVSNIAKSSMSSHQDSQLSSSDLHNVLLQPTSDTNVTDTVEEIYVLLHPLKRKSSNGEKTLLEKKPSSPEPYDYHSPVAANDVLKARSRIETPEPFAEDQCDTSLEIVSETTYSSNKLNEALKSPQDQCVSLYHMDTQSNASMPARIRKVSESCTQTDEKPSSEQNELLPSVIDNALMGEEKVSVIPLNLVYYPHYEVPVSKVLEAFSVTGSPQKELVPEFQKDLSPLADEAYQSCSELSGSFSLQELSPTFSEKTLCTPDSDQIDSSSISNHAEPGKIAQSFSSYQGTDLSQFLPVAIHNAANESIVNPLNKLPDQPNLEAINERFLEEKPSVTKSGDLQIPKSEHEKDQDENSPGPEALNNQLLHSLQSQMGLKETGKDVEIYGSGPEQPADTKDGQHNILQSSVISCSPTLVSAENSQEKSSYDVFTSHKDHNHEFCLKAMNDQCSSESEEHTSNQDEKLIQDEHCSDPNMLSLIRQHNTRHKIPESLVLLNEAKFTDETHLQTRSDQQSDNASVLEAMWHPTAAVIRDKVPPGSPTHPQLPYLVVILWMAVYWLIILLHLDLESLGPSTAS
ncbi:calmin-like isoform X1 [Chiloscyllium plagiosum]|uniref:calmin-like isoform X1 n=1 Tax=Chiloscyllium plagiosum TaxID=36176 RepID=UPI001CB84A71|nr:calmin-like isoform X1 [Chiloscyllium plagiosum]